MSKSHLAGYGVNNSGVESDHRSELHTQRVIKYHNEFHDGSSPRSSTILTYDERVVQPPHMAPKKSGSGQDLLSLPIPTPPSPVESHLFRDDLHHLFGGELRFE